jgi:hypothetical protein
MKKLVYAGLVLALAVAAILYAAPLAQVEARETKILEWDTMVGVPKALTGNQNPIRGINGGGLPWVVGPVKGQLKESGKLELLVTGLVFDPSDPTVIERGLANKNTVANFKAIVSCLAADGSVQNVATGLFPATTGDLSAGAGTSRMEANLTLPQPCLAPLVFVTNPAGAWFAVTGK